MKYLAVDIGNVICRMNFDKFLSKLEADVPCSKEQAFELMYKLQKVQDLGILTIGEELSYTSKLSKEAIKDILHEWDSTLSPEEFIVNSLIELMSRGVQIALLSNIGTEHASIIRNILSPKLYDNSIKFFSCDVGARKPSYLYYKTFIDMYPDFKGCVYIDDRPENIATGITFGFESCLFDIESFNSHSEMVEMFHAIENLVEKSQNG
jgi:FMN phosphatase YigB (HAD superfamily)